MSRFIVMDIVFYGSSLNYDQGAGNYQELKKITKWDGKQYTLVSRYALRYSLLETAKSIGLWKLAEGDKFQLAGKGNNKVIQPSTEILLNGEILNYPEFDLFGYLITSTTPQNFRSAPVKISHAISMTPFNYDALFNANIGLANRVRKKVGEMAPNQFTAEEHVTFYQYTIVVDLDNIGKIEVYLTKDKEIKLKDNKDEWKIDKVEKENGKIKIHLKKGESEKKTIEQQDVKGKLLELENVFVLEYSMPDFKAVEKRVKELVKAIINLKRCIKGREEDLSPKLMILGIYKNHPYRIYKDKIFLKDKYSEESYAEIEEKEENGKKVVKVKHVIVKTKKPVFEVMLKNGTNEAQEISEEAVIKFIERLFTANGNEFSEVKVFYDSGIEVKLK